MNFHARAMSGASAVALEHKDADPAAVALDVKKGFEDFQKLWTEFQAKNDERLKQLEGRGEDAVTKEELKAINDALDTLKTEVNAQIVELKRQPVAGNDNVNPDLAAYSKKFEDYFRNGYGSKEGSLSDYKSFRDLELKAMSTQSDTDGGFTARPELETAIDATVKQVSPIRDYATVRIIGAKNYKKLVNTHGTASGWVGEADSRPQTQGPLLKELDFPAMELYAMPAATSDLLDDAFINIDQWLADEVSLEFAYQEGAAFVSGDGNKKPRGFLAYNNVANASYAWGKIGYVLTGKSAGFSTSSPADCLVDLFHALKPIYRKNATWMLNNTTLAATRKLKDGQGNYLINRQFTTDGIVESMMGKPAVEVVDMPDPAENSFSIAFGDFKRGYLIVDRRGISVLRDPYTAKPYVLFYTTKRVGGGVQNYEAIKLLKFSAS
jgi:HK97 family phage major capsid protein